MKKWENAELTELNISATAGYHLSGKTADLWAGTGPVVDSNATIFSYFASGEDTSQKANPADWGAIITKDPTVVKP